MEFPDVQDPTDWLTTSVPQLGALEVTLHCQICKDFFTTPMITSCSHTFCSLCIRRCLTEDGCCPSCRAPDQIVKLRQNWTAQESVETFLAVRPAMMQLALQDVEEPKTARKRLKSQGPDLQDRYPQDRLSQSPSMLSPERAPDNAARKTSPPLTNESDDLSACPICGKRMKEEAVFSHLDVHNDQSRRQPQISSSSRAPVFRNKDGKDATITERLPQINYSLMKENALRRKLTELEIPSHGPRTLLIRRHTEWVNLVNSNCDSKSPRTRRELLRDLETWDKTQGRQFTSGSSVNANPISQKNFDGGSWAVAHSQSYKDLVASARKSVKSGSANAALPMKRSDHEEDSGRHEEH